MKAEQVDFISSYLPLARKAGESFRINPIVILAQAVIESGWGQSDLAREHHNFFGITAYGKKNVWWKGEGIELGVHSLRFRLRHSAGFLHGLRPPDPPCLHPGGRRQQQPAGFRPFHLIQPLHQRSQRRQPRSLPHLADKALPTDREN